MKPMTMPPTWTRVAHRRSSLGLRGAGGAYAGGWSLVMWRSFLSDEAQRERVAEGSAVVDPDGGDDGEHDHDDVDGELHEADQEAEQQEDEVDAVRRHAVEPVDDGADD